MFVATVACLDGNYDENINYLVGVYSQFAEVNFKDA